MDSLFGGSKQTTKSSPWGPQQPYLKDIFSQAQNLYNNNPSSYYPGSTVAPMNTTQTGALGDITGTAANNPFTGAATDFGTNLVSGDYLNSNPGFSYFQNLADPNSAQNKTLQDYASGNYMNSNPYDDPTAQAILAQVVPQVTKGFVNSNSLNNPAAAYSIAQGAAAGLAPYEFSNYQKQQEYQQNAANSLNQNQATAGQGIGTMYGQGMDDMIRGLALGPQTQELAYGDIMKRLQAGTITQDQAQKELSDQVNAYNFNQQAPWNDLSNYLSSVTGNYGGNTTTSQSSNPLTSILGGLMGIGNMFGGASAAGGMSAAGGSGAMSEILPAIMAMSDVRLKRDIENIGTLPNGLNIYSFKFLWDDAPHVGVMAQEVELQMPEAMGPDFLGFKTVDYAKVLGA